MNSPWNDKEGTHIVAVKIIIINIETPMDGWVGGSLVCIKKGWGEVVGSYKRDDP